MGTINFSGHVIRTYTASLRIFFVIFNRINPLFVLRLICKRIVNYLLQQKRFF
ncbi:hypothetical protein GCM10011573_38530 [Enterococcus wangshanyuanii]|uniref:Uncharacterized protein n=1 Tax=Enterococcus wangshanyuanii TaxID=2005703 RepID=A0ABQ1PVS2_9ENTE|nr:hypothetical protein GCM10011573_38530 [Enterococcus wangshanyuanii]